MTKWHHQLFRAMPRGRLLLASELHRIADLPRGWSVGDVREALKRFVADGEVEVERLALGRGRYLNGYRRRA
jgi:hypothetical protein